MLNVISADFKIISFREELDCTWKMTEMFPLHPPPPPLPLGLVFFFFITYRNLITHITLQLPVLCQQRIMCLLKALFSICFD